MCWTDKIATEQILKLRDEFLITTAIATGTFYGADVELYAQYFKEVYSMDIEPKYWEIASAKLANYRNVTLALMPSWEFIVKFRDWYELRNRNDIVYFYLDAHFYDPDLAPEDKWVVVRELKALKDFRNCVICLHDFDNGELGHLIYDGEPLGWNVISEHIRKVNPDFYYYTNTKEWCDIYNEETVKELPLTVDEYVLDGIRYANRSDEKRYRGILYAIPYKLNLAEYKLMPYGQARTYII